MNTRSIHLRLTAWYTLLVFVTSAAFGAYTYYSVSHRLYQEMTQTLARRAAHVRDNILPEIARDTPTQLAQEMREIYSPEESSRFIRIARAYGPVLYVSGTPRDRDFDPALVSPPRAYTSRISSRIEHAGGKSSLLVVGLNARAGNTSYIVEMGAPTASIESPLRKLVATMLIGLPFVIAAGAGGGSLLIRRALRPVETIRATAERITFGNVRQRLPVAHTGDAVEHLSSTLNQMLERLDQTYQQAARFSADASHELRTPLAVMRSEMESLLHAPLPAGLRGRVASLLEETERLSAIVEGLFAIARLDAGEAKIRHEPFDLSDLVRATVEQMRLLADEKNIAVVIDAPAPVAVAGDAARLKQVIVNLLDNAVKYTPAEGAVVFTVRGGDGLASLTIADNGIGIAPDALPHIFERFYRADRVRSGGSEGAGLGLSIVRAICQAHGGAVQVQSAEGRGAIVTVTLPLAAKSVREDSDAAA